MKPRPKEYQPIRVLIIEDHPVVREGLVCILDDSPEISIVGQVGTGEDGLALARELRPDVLVVDIELPGMDGLDVAETLRRELPQTRIILLSVHHSTRHLERATEAGVHGYLLKNAPPEHLVKAVLQVGRNKSGGVAAMPAKPAGIEGLSELDRKVLIEVANGRTNKEIGKIFGLAERTIQSYRERIRQRLNIDTTAGLTKFAIAQGLVAPQKE